MVRNLRSEDHPPEPASSWFEDVPHRRLDRLIDRVDQGLDLDPEDAQELLSDLVGEVVALRREMSQMSTVALEEGERLAAETVAGSRRLADRLRETGLSALDERMVEAGDALAFTRESFRLQRRVADAARHAGPRLRPVSRDGREAVS